MLCACSNVRQRHFTSLHTEVNDNKVMDKFNLPYINFHETNIDSYHISSLTESVTDIFGLKTDTTGTKRFNLLFVMDNSNSMREIQKEKLPRNMKSFIQKFQHISYAYKIGVITTDEYIEHQGLHSGPSKTPILTQSTSNIEELFTENINVGLDGSLYESGMKSVIAFLKRRSGQDFVKDKSYLKVIIVSDEKDSDPLNETNYVSHYMNKLRKIQGGDNFSVSVIVDKSMPARYIAMHFPKKYIALARASSGNIYDISNNFSSIMDKIGQSVKNNIKALSLSHLPEYISSMEVYVNDVKKIKDTDWFYDENTNRISFDSFSTYKEGDSVKIIYEYRKSTFSFVLRKNKNPIEGAMEVFMNKQKINDWSYNKRENKIVFRSNEQSLNLGDLFEIHYQMNREKQNKFYFQLAKKPDISTLEVFVDGKAIEKGHWGYDETTNKISLDSNSVLKIEDEGKIEIQYTERIK